MTAERSRPMPSMAPSLLSRRAPSPLVIDRFIRTVVAPRAETGHIAAWALDFGGAQHELATTILRSHAAMPMRVPRAHELFIWFGAPAAGEEAAALLAARLLDRAERAQALAFALSADRASYVAAHAMARMLLACTLGCAPQEVALARDVRGKPHVSPQHRAHGMVHFSISHARGLAAVALAGRPVGIDVERAVAFAKLEAVARNVFAAEALEALRGAADARARTALFFRFWTLGEAFLKATGLGLAEEQRFAFTPVGPARLTRIDADLGPPQRWRFGLMDGFDGRAAWPEGPQAY